jgi:uncharacterized small protein (DUF1192 family)
MEKELDLNLVLSAMRERIGALAQENAILQAQLNQHDNDATA